MGTFGRFRQWMSRIRRRVPVVVALAACAAMPALALAASPSYYVPKHAKAHCRSGYSKKTVTITVKHRHHKVKKHQVRCVKKGSSGGGGSGVTFPSGLPTVTVTPTIIPTVTSHSYSTNAGQTLSVPASGVLAGAKGLGLMAQLVSGPESGSLSLSKDGGFSYTPAAGASGIVHFTYRVSDRDSDTSKPATVTIDVVPVAAGASYSVPAAGTLSLSAGQLLSSDTGTGLTAGLVTATSHGAISLGAGGLTYSPTPGYSGADSFSYLVTDADGLVSNTVTVTINVGAGPPNVVPQAFTGAVGNTPLAVGGSQGSGPEVYQAASSPLLVGDSDPNGGGALTITPETASTAQGGSVTVTSDGSFAYSPPAGFDGPTADSFSYEVNTTEGTSASETATISFAATRVWYVDNAGANGNGTAGSPFDSLGAATAVASSGDDIYLYTGSGNYTSGVLLAPGVSLVGQGSALSVGNETLAAAGTAPVITNGSSDVITIQGDATVSGVTVHSTSGNGVSATGSGTVTLDSMTISSIGGDGIHASGPEVLSVTGSTITGSTGHGIVFGGTGAVAQTFIVDNVHISGQSGDALSLTGFNGDAQGVIVNSTLGSSAADGVNLGDSADTLKLEAYGNTITSHTGIAVSGAGTSELDLTLDNPNATSPNVLDTVGDGVSIVGSPTATCLSAVSNSVTAAGGTAISLNDGGGTFSISGGTNPFDADTYLTTNNTLNSGTVSLTGSFAATANACPLPQINTHLQ